MPELPLYFFLLVQCWRFLLKLFTSPMLWFQVDFHSSFYHPTKWYLLILVHINTSAKYSQRFFIANWHTYFAYYGVKTNALYHYFHFSFRNVCYQLHINLVSPQSFCYLNSILPPSAFQFHTGTITNPKVLDFMSWFSSYPLPPKVMIQFD